MTAAGLAIVQGLTGAITSGASAVWDAITGKQPVDVLAVTDPVSFVRESLRPDYVFPLPVEELSDAPPNQFNFETVDRWAASLGTIDANATAVQITVTGRSPEPVILTNLRVRAVERRAPVNGTHVTLPTSGPVVVRGFNADLDAAPPFVRPRLDDQDMLGENVEPVSFPFRVSATEPEVF